MTCTLSDKEEEQFIKDIATLAKPFLRAVEEMADKKGVPVYELLEVTTQAYLTVGRYILENDPGIRSLREIREKGD